MPITAESFKVKFKSQLTLFQTQIRCQVDENEYNLSLNPTMMQPCSASIADNVTGSYFDPYVTSIGLYNEQNDLLAVAKLSRPYRMPSNTDTTFIIRYDT